MKIPLQLNYSSSCGGPTTSKDGSWRSSVVSGGGGGAWGHWGGFRGRGGGRKWLFHTASTYLKPATLAWASLAHLGELIQLQIFYFGEKKIIYHTIDVILQIPTVRIWIIVLGTSRKTLKMIQQLTNPVERFY